MDPQQRWTLETTYRAMENGEQNVLKPQMDDGLTAYADQPVYQQRRLRGPTPQYLLPRWQMIGP